MTPILRYAAACLTIIGVTLAVLHLAFRQSEERMAVRWAAAVALAVQILTFLIVRMMARRKNVIAGWGIGVALRFASLAVFALAVVPGLNLPLTAGLVGLATMLFLSTLVEPLFLES